MGCHRLPRQASLHRASSSNSCSVRRPSKSLMNTKGQMNYLRLRLRSWLPCRGVSRRPRADPDRHPALRPSAHRHQLGVGAVIHMLAYPVEGVGVAVPVFVPPPALLFATRHGTTRSPLCGARDTRRGSLESRVIAEPIDCLPRWRQRRRRERRTSATPR
jgi:hypothetical protein